MDHDFPSPHLDKKTVAKSIDGILSTDVVIGANDGMILPVSRTSFNGTKVTFLLPSFYERYFKLLVYRVNSIALVLKFWDEFKASDPTVTNKSWITLAQHVVYFTNVLEFLDRSVGKANMDSTWRCRDFDRVLVSELLVHRHEPIFAYSYRASRKNSDPNLNTCSLDSLDLEKYFNKIGDIVSGRSNDFRLESQDISTARAILGPMLAYYSNSERISIGVYKADPHVKQWGRYGLPVRDPFSTDVGDLDVMIASSPDEEEDEEGDEDEDDGGKTTSEN